MPEKVKQTQNIEIDPTESQKKILRRYLHHLSHLWNYLVDISQEDDYKNTKGGIYDYIKEWTAQGWTDGLSQPANQLGRNRFYEAYDEWKNGVRGRPQYKDTDDIQSLKTAVGQSEGLEHFDPGTYHSFKFDASVGVLRTRQPIIIPPHVVNDSSSKKYVRVKRTADGKWYACFTLSLLINYPAAGELKRHEWVGIDPGINSLVTLSDGRLFHASELDEMRELWEREKELQKRFDSKDKGSKNQDKAEAKLKKHGAKIRRKRRDILHKISRRMVEYTKNRYRGIAWEGTNIQDMMEDEDYPAYRKDEVSNMAWNQLKRYVEYKAHEEGMAFQEQKAVDKFASSKTCHRCTHKHAVNNRKPYDRFQCPTCGVDQGRDVNAARNIRDAVYLTSAVDEDWDKETLRSALRDLRSKE